MINKNLNLGVRRDIGAINWTGLYTLYLKEVKRFTNVFLQTITAPYDNNVTFCSSFFNCN